MKSKNLFIAIIGAVILCLNPVILFSQTLEKESIIEEKLLYHPIHLNSTNNTILPWYSSDLDENLSPEN